MKDNFLCVFQQPEDAPASLQMMIAFFIRHLCHFLPFPFILTPIALPLARVPPALSGWCSWSSTPCCGWSNGTKSGVSVRFGPLQPATASAHSGGGAKAQRRCGVWSVDSSTSLSYFHQCLAVPCSTMYGNKRLMTTCIHITVLFHLKVVFAAQQVASQL